MCQQAYIEILSMWEIWRARKRRNFSLLSALQTSQVLNILTYTVRTDEARTLFHNIINYSDQCSSYLIIYFCSVHSKKYASMSTRLYTM